MKKHHKSLFYGVFVYLSKKMTDLHSKRTDITNNLIYLKNILKYYKEYVTIIMLDS